MDSIYNKVGEIEKIEDLLREKREEILRIAARYGAYNVRVFGSVVRGNANSANDVDFLVDMKPDRSLLDLGGLLMDLQDLLGREVDVVTEKGLHWYIRDRVLAEARPLWKMINSIRNILVHNYLGIDLEQVWLIVEQDLPHLQREVEVMLQALDDEV